MNQPCLARYFLILSIIYSLFNCENQEITTSLEGYVYKSPIHPVEIQGQINYAPFSALFHVYNISGDKITSFSSNIEGAYKIKLLPGNYKIIPDKSAPIMGAQYQIKEVKVAPIGISILDLYFDTGIR